MAALNIKFSKDKFCSQIFNTFFIHDDEKGVTVEKKSSFLLLFELKQGFSLIILTVWFKNSDLTNCQDSFSISLMDINLSTNVWQDVDFGTILNVKVHYILRIQF